MKKNKFNIPMNLQFFAQNENNSDNIDNVNNNTEATARDPDNFAEDNSKKQNSDSDLVDPIGDDYYISFKTKEEYTKDLKKSTEHLLSKISFLEKENKDLKSFQAENNNLNSILNTFSKDILDKYGVKDFTLNQKDLDFTSLDRFEKSILSTLELKKVNYKKPNISTADKKEEQKIKIYF